MAHDVDQRRFSVRGYKDIGMSYLAEVRELIHVVERPDFEQLLTCLADYAFYLATSSTDRLGHKLVVESAPDERIFDVATTTQTQVLKALAMAQLAACCYLLHGSRIKRQQLCRDALEMMAEQFVESLASKSDEYLKRIDHKFHVMDSIRSMQLLRVLGLVTRSTHEIYQIGFGSADGTRDVLGLHLIPSIRQVTSDKSVMLELSIDKQLVSNIIITDSNPLYAEQYDELNNDSSNNITAINQDTMTVLKHMAGATDVSRNLVTALRIEHRMIPDVYEFLAQLGKYVTHECDFMLSIGAGDTCDDFRGRIICVNELFSALEDAGMRPFLFKFHDSGDIEHQWASLKYGNPSASTYQLLYCRLNGAALVDSFNQIA